MLKKKAIDRRVLSRNFYYCLSCFVQEVDEAHPPDWEDVERRRNCTRDILF